MSAPLQSGYSENWGTDIKRPLPKSKPIDNITKWFAEYHDIDAFSRLPMNNLELVCTSELNSVKIIEALIKLVCKTHTGDLHTLISKFHKEFCNESLSGNIVLKDNILKKTHIGLFYHLITPSKYFAGKNDDTHYVIAYNPHTGLFNYYIYR